jgi:glycosyltransferase involved in cell wall biosynthesis
MQDRAPAIAMFLPSVEGGGAERVFIELANVFVSLGLRVHLLLAAARGPYLNEIHDGVRIIELGSRGVLRSLPKLVEYLRAERPAALLSALDHSNLIAILARWRAATGTRCVISMRSVPSAVYREERYPKRWLLPMLMRRAYPHADRIIANSQAVASDLTDRFAVPADKVSIIYNPLDLDSVDRLGGEAINDAWLAKKRSPMILSVGRLSPLKDFPTLIRAFSIVRAARECRLAILGEGAERRRLEELVAELGLQEDVYLPGFVQNPFAWMRSAKLLVCSSLTEGCPNALMQALACGTAVVSTDCIGGCAEILQDGRWGRLVPVKDVPAMAAAISASLDGAAAIDVKQRAADFAIDAVARTYLRQLMPDFTLPAAVQ